MEALNQLPFVVLFAVLPSYFLSRGSQFPERTMALGFLGNFVLSAVAGTAAHYLFKSLVPFPATPKEIISFSGNQFLTVISAAFITPWLAYSAILILRKIYR